MPLMENCPPAVCCVLHAEPPRGLDLAGLSGCYRCVSAPYCVNRSCRDCKHVGVQNTLPSGLHSLPSASQAACQPPCCSFLTDGFCCRPKKWYAPSRLPTFLNHSVSHRCWRPVKRAALPALLLESYPLLPAANASRAPRWSSCWHLAGACTTPGGEAEANRLGQQLREWVTEAGGYVHPALQLSLHTPHGYR